MGQTSSVSALVQGQRDTPWQTVTCQREEVGYPEKEKGINYLTILMGLLSLISDCKFIMEVSPLSHSFTSSPKEKEDSRCHC